MGEFGIGQPVPREEDPYLVRGAGRYVDDVPVPGKCAAMCCARRTARPHRASTSADAAKTMPGVHLVLTGEDAAIRARHAAPADAAQAARRLARRASPQPFLARDGVRYVGDPVAFVVAETLEQAKDAAEAIEVDYEDAARGRERRGRDQARRARGVGGLPGQSGLLFMSAGDKAAVERAFASAAHVVKHRMVINRITTNSHGAARLPRRISISATSRTRCAARCRART